MDISAAVAAFNAQSEAEGWEQLCDPACAFAHRDFAAMIGLWNNLAGGRAMPSRSDMSARALKPFLPSIGLKERVQSDPVRYRWRLMGTRVAQVIGERTGKFVDENAPPRQVARWNASCDLVLAGGVPLRFVGRVLAEGKDFMASELLFVPLAGDDGAARFVMGFGHYSAEKTWRQVLAAAPAMASA